MVTAQIPVERRAPGRLHIGGEWIESASGSTFETVSPATGEVIAEIAEGGAPDIELAVEAARRAIAGCWRGLDAAERGAILWRSADTIEERSGELARLESLESAKPIREAMIDRRMIVDTFRYIAGWATKIE